MERSKGAKAIARLASMSRRFDNKKRRPPKGKGGSEAVSVEPNRPKQGEGGAAAALEFDE